MIDCNLFTSILEEFLFFWIKLMISLYIIQKVKFFEFLYNNRDFFI